MEKRVLTVLRSGGEYGPQHVQAIQRQVKKWASADTEFFCLSDVPVPGVRNRIPLKHKWPGWWAKLELFRTDVPSEFLYTDLDNVVLGPIDELVSTGVFTADIGFSFFRMTRDVSRSWAYEEFRSDSEAAMRVWDPATRQDSRFGDAAFLRWQCGLRPAEWAPDHVANVVHFTPPCPWRVAPPTIPPGLRVLLCGGKARRPWRQSSQVIQNAYWCREKA